MGCGRVEINEEEYAGEGYNKFDGVSADVISLMDWY
jgi:hypothetical protein